MHRNDAIFSKSAMKYKTTQKVRIGKYLSCQKIYIFKGDIPPSIPGIPPGGGTPDSPWVGPGRTRVLKRSLKGIYIPLPITVAPAAPAVRLPAARGGLQRPACGPRDAPLRRPRRLRPRGHPRRRPDPRRHATPLRMPSPHPVFFSLDFPPEFNFCCKFTIFGLTHILKYIILLK